MGVSSPLVSEPLSSSDIPTALNKSKTIQSLPKEILIRIFEFVYLASCSLDFEQPSSLSDPALFPTSLENVCRAWKRLMRTVAHFSERVIICVDQPVDWKDLRKRFECSKALLIKVYIIRKEYGVEDDVQERPRVKGVMQLLVEHIERCKVVVFDVLHNSSLPRISDFSEIAQSLLTLRTRSRLPGVGPAIPDPTPTFRRNFQQFLCPNLRYLDMDGNILIDAMKISGWTESFRSVSQKRLTLRNMPHVDYNDYDLFSFLTGLSKLHHLTELVIENVELDPQRCLQGIIFPTFIQNFIFTGLSGSFVATFLNAIENKIEDPNITLTRCGLGCNTGFRFEAWSLTLSEIAPEEDLYTFLCAWNGFNLNLWDCPGVDNSVLRAVSETPNPRRPIRAPTFRELGINARGPIPITVSALKEMVIARKAEANKHVPEEYPMRSVPLPMYSIYISGIGNPLEPSDTLWFKERVDVFTWNAYRPSSPILYWDAAKLAASEFEHVPELSLAGPLPPVSQTPSLETHGTGISSSQLSLPPPSSSLEDSDDELLLVPRPKSPTPILDSPTIEADYSILNWSIEDLDLLP